MKPFNPTKPVKFVIQTTVKKVIVLAHDLEGEFPIIVKYKTPNGWFTTRHRATGEVDRFQANSDYDLINIPETPKLRVWRFEEVPLNAIFRHVHNGPKFSIYIPFYLCGRGICFRVMNVFIAEDKNEFSDHLVSLEDLCALYEHSLDNGKTWHPCGVLE